MRRVLRCIPEDSVTYRYLLDVQVLEFRAVHRLAIVLKNPSLAGIRRSDPTVGKVEAWARRQGFTQVIYVNLFALRSPYPSLLNEYPYDYAVGPENDTYVREAVAGADVVVAAWGNPNGVNRERYNRRIAELLRLLGPWPLKIVGQPTRLGYPRHGLLWNGDLALINWPDARR